jgi:hypothetical protein
MKDLMTKSMTALVATLALLGLTAQGCPKAGDITPGGACSQQDSKHTNSNGVSYTCKSVPGGNRIWQQDAPLTTDRP